MARIFYVHWNQDEASAVVRMLRNAVYAVAYHHETTEAARIDRRPDVCVISPARLPSHGRANAERSWDGKNSWGNRRLFVGGEKEKVERTRARIPEAEFCGDEELATVLARPGSKAGKDG